MRHHPLIEELPMAAVRLRVDQFAKICASLGWTTDEKAAAAIGVVAAQVNRVRRGRRAPGQRFIAGVLQAAYPYGWTFEDLFEVVPDNDGDDEEVA